MPESNPVLFRVIPRFPGIFAVERGSFAMLLAENIHGCQMLQSIECRYPSSWKIEPRGTYPTWVSWGPRDGVPCCKKKGKTSHHDPDAVPVWITLTLLLCPASFCHHAPSLAKRCWGCMRSEVLMLVVNCFKFKTIHDEHQDDMSWQLLAQGSES